MRKTRKTLRKSRKSRKVRKSTKVSKRNYTAFIPKTAKATKNVGKKSIKIGTSFFKGILKTVKNLSRSIDKQTAKAIHSLTKKRRA